MTNAKYFHPQKLRDLTILRTLTVSAFAIWPRYGILKRPNHPCKKFKCAGQTFTAKLITTLIESRNPEPLT